MGREMPTSASALGARGTVTRCAAGLAPAVWRGRAAALQETRTWLGRRPLNKAGFRPRRRGGWCGPLTADHPDVQAL